MSRRLSASVLLFACAASVAVACNGARTGELEPRCVAVHNTLAALGLVQTGPAYALEYRTLK